MTQSNSGFDVLFTMAMLDDIIKPLRHDITELRQLIEQMSAPKPTKNPIVHTANTWIDSYTNLEWEKDYSDPMSFPKARSYAGTKQHEWRLPTVKELISLVFYGVHNPASLAPLNWPDTSLGFWTSGVYGGHKVCQDQIWRVHFFDGGVNCATPSTLFRVRCVRNAKNRRMP